MNNFTANYSARLRGRTKQPVYTSDKRAKFTQRENKKARAWKGISISNSSGQTPQQHKQEDENAVKMKKKNENAALPQWEARKKKGSCSEEGDFAETWIRFATVLGYIFFVSLPAVSLSIYYVYMWDPGYINKFQREAINYSVPIHNAPFMKPRLQRGAAAPMAASVTKSYTYTPGSLPTSKPCPTCASNSMDLGNILAEGLKSMESSLETIHSTSKEGHVL